MPHEHMFENNCGKIALLLSPLASEIHRAIHFGLRRMGYFDTQAMPIHAVGSGR
jgi:hypothetical protein